MERFRKGLRLAILLRTSLERDSDFQESPIVGVVETFKSVTVESRGGEQRKLVVFIKTKTTVSTTETQRDDEVAYEFD